MLSLHRYWTWTSHPARYRPLLCTWPPVLSPASCPCSWVSHLPWGQSPQHRGGRAPGAASFAQPCFPHTLSPDTIPFSPCPGAGTAQYGRATAGTRSPEAFNSLFL